MEKERSHKENKEESLKDQALEKKTPNQPSVKVVVVVKDKTEIGYRLDAAVKAAKPVNRSSDLVPLNHDYDLMRRNLKALIASAQKYHAAMISLDKARMDMAMKFSALAMKTPIFSPIGDTVESDSLVAVAQAASKQTNASAMAYQDKVVDYCVEWERLVSTRVDTELKETGKLHEKLNHYQIKVIGLRNKVTTITDKGKYSPKKLSDRFERNEKKLDQAWRAHERSASKLCYLLEEVTAQGWKDLYPLVKASIQWEVEQTSAEYDIFARLPVVTEELIDAFESNKSNVQEGSNVPIALEDADGDSETTSSFHPDDSSTASTEHEVPASPKRNGSPKIKHATRSSKSVAEV